MTSRSACRHALALLLGYLGLSAAAGVYLAEGVVHPGRVPVTAADRQAAHRIAAARGARLDDVERVSFDGKRLRAWLFTPTTPRTGAVVVLHGQASNRAGMLPFIDLMLSAGLQVLAPDARAQGESEGTLVSYGVVERADVQAWADDLRRRNGGRCVYGFAESMGAGTLLQALGEDGRFCRVVVESPFASFREVAYDRVGAVFHTGPWFGRSVLRPVVDGGLLCVLVRYGIALDQAAPILVLPRTQVPVLLIHGSADTSIPVRHSRALAAARPQGTTLWEVPGAEHCGAFGVAPREFATRVLGMYGLAPGPITNRH